MSGKIWICGLGVLPPAETTLEALRAFERVPVVFCDAVDPALRRWLGRFAKKLVKPASAAQVLRAAREGDCALAVWGHPQFSSALARAVEASAAKAGLAYEVLGAISPVGSAFARSISFLGGDYGYQGLQSYSLETLLADGDLATPRLPLIVYSEGSAKAAWARLFKALAKKYPSGHAAVFYDGEGREQSATLERMAAKPPESGVLLVAPNAALARRNAR